MARTLLSNKARGERWHGRQASREWRCNDGVPFSSYGYRGGVECSVRLRQHSDTNLQVFKDVQEQVNRSAYFTIFDNVEAAIQDDGV